MASTPRFAILGAGNGGLSMAGDLALRGFEISGLFDRFDEAVAPVRRRGGIEMMGEVLNGFAPIANATTDIAAAVDGADVVVVVVPAFAHEWMATQVAPHLQDGQIVLLTPGYPGGTLSFRRTLESSGLRADIDLAETNLILYATRIVGPAQVGVKGIKHTLYIAALPASRTPHVVDVLKPAIPQLEPLANVLEVGFNCSNPYSHVPTILLNWARAEQDSGDQHFDWHDWVSPGVRTVQQTLEAEREALLNTMGIRYLSPKDLEQASYRGEKWKIVPVMGEIPSGAKTIPPRYIFEDVPIGLVAYASMAEKLDVPMPAHNLMIDLASLLKQTDFRQEGRTVDKMGISDKSMGEILDLVGAYAGVGRS